MESASIVNSTPYSEISEDPNDPLPLSPQHILTLRENINTTPEDPITEESQCYGKRRWKRVQFLADEFWKRWRDDYLSTLLPRKKWRRGRPNLEVGNIVLIRGECPRSRWPLGRISEAIPDRDGKVRKVKVTCVSQGEAKPKVFERAIHHLVKLL